MTINGYNVIGGKFTGAGQCEWAFASKGDKEFHIKRFLSPKYPKPEAPGSAKTKAKMIERCKQFENRQNLILKNLHSICPPGGNLIMAEEFFREGTAYYKTTPKIDINSPKPKEISKWTLDEQLLLFKTSINSLNILHSAGSGIVHGDLKPDNIIVNKTKSGEWGVGKLIDFDDSYFCDAPPESKDDLSGTPEYYSPEVHDFITGKGSSESLTTRSDIFTMGLIFHEYLTGALPDFLKAEFKYPCNQVLYGKPLGTSSKIPLFLLTLINDMVSLDPKKRPSCPEITLRLNETTASRDEKTALPVINIGLKIKKPLEEKTTSITPTPLSEGTVTPTLKSKFAKPSPPGGLKPD